MSRLHIDTSNQIIPADAEILIELHKRVNPDGTLPQIGGINQKTWVIRDNERIVGMLHFEKSIEIRTMATDPEYEYRSMALTVAFHAAETVMREQGHAHYYISVPHDHHHVRKFYDTEAERVDKGHLRYRKVL